jgi:plastocyanin
VHTALQLTPVLAAEKSKVAFYIAGGVLIAWALIISLGVGLRKPDFPANVGQQRAVMAVTVVLVATAISMAVVTSGTPSKSSAAKTTSSSAAATSTSSSEPAATTGTPTPASSPASSHLELAANPEGELKYSTKELSAKAGTVTITMTNMSPLEHNVTIEQSGKVLGATPTFKGGSKTLTLDLKPGKYTFFCSVPGHRQAGMEGTLTVSS